MPTDRILLLGALAGLTIFLGLPAGRLRNPALQLKAFLSAAATGILLFIFWDVLKAASEPVEESAPAGSADVVAAGELADLLSSLESDEAIGETYPAALQTPDLGLDTDTDTDTDTDIVLPEEVPASGVISTDAFLADFDSGDGSYTSGMGDELCALTGGGTARMRPQATVARLAPEGEHVLHRDRHVDRALVERIIEGVKKL